MHLRKISSIIYWISNLRTYDRFNFKEGENNFFLEKDTYLLKRNLYC